MCVAEACFSSLSLSVSFKGPLLTILRQQIFRFPVFFLDVGDSLRVDAMADVPNAEAVEVTTARPIPAPGTSAPDFLPLDDSDSSDGSSSDVPMTAETDEEDNADPSATTQTTQLNQAAAASNNAVDLRAGLTRKRKSWDEASDNSSGQSALEPVKKVKLAKSAPKDQHQGDGSLDQSKLAGEVWQHIFTFCPPKTLGRLLLVNRLFNVYLDPSSQVQCERPQPLSESAVPILQPNCIWQASRRRFWPGMAIPLQDKTELYMWKLSCSNACQHCGSTMPLQTDPSDPWQAGPGIDGIAIIWPFSTRSCGSCLLKNSIKVCSAKQHQKEIAHRS